MSGDFEIQQVFGVRQSILRVFLIGRAYLLLSRYQQKMIT